MFKVSCADPIPNGHCAPREHEVYVMCQDHSIQSVFDPKTKIGWYLIEDNNEFFYRAMESAFAKKCYVFFHGRLDDIPAGDSQKPQFAEVIEQGDDGEDEVSSV